MINITLFKKEVLHFVKFLIDSNLVDSLEDLIEKNVHCDLASKYWGDRTIFTTTIDGVPYEIEHKRILTSSHDGGEWLDEFKIFNPVEGTKI